MDASPWFMGAAAERWKKPPKTERAAAGARERLYCDPEAGLMFFWSMWSSVTVLESLRGRGAHRGESSCSRAC